MTTSSFTIQSVQLAYGDVRELPSEQFSSLWNNEDEEGSYSYCTWLTVYEREINSFVSILHHGGGEWVRCPGIWLHSLSNQLHVKVDTNQQINQGIEWSKSELPLNQAVHVAVVADSLTGKLSLYLNGVLDSAYAVCRTSEEKFKVGRTQGCYIGKSPWYGSSSITLEDTIVYSRAITEAEIYDVMMRSRRQLDPNAAAPNILPTLTVANPRKRLQQRR